MKNIRYNIKYKMTGLLIAMAILPVAAQTLHENISVEGKYVPEIVKIDRIYYFPESEKFPLETSPLQYDMRSVPAAFQPTLMTMPLTGWNVTKDFSHLKGYLELGLGSWLNSTLSAGSRFLDTQNTVAGAWLQFNSTSLWHPEMNRLSHDIKRSRYDGTIGIYGSHLFDTGHLEASMSWHTGYFNYFSWTPQSDTQDSYKAPTQTLNDIAFSLGWHSPAKRECLVWDAGFKARYFGYRTMWIPNLSDRMTQTHPARETRLSVNGGLMFPWDSGSAIGLDLDFNTLLYSTQSNVVYNGVVALRKPDNYSQLSLNPSYRFSKGLFNISIGAEIDFTFNAGPQTSRYSIFHIAPDVRLDMRKGSVGFYLNVAGGSELETLADLHELDYYQMPTVASTRPVYSPLDSELGLNFGPFSGFTAGMDFSYKISRRQPMGGWYGAMFAIPLLNEWLDANNASGTPNFIYDTEGINLHGLSFGLNAIYTTGKVFKAQATMKYQPQNGKKGYFNGYDRPRWVIGVNGTLNPWQTLKLTLGYDYRGVRNIYTRIPNTDSNGSDRLFAMRLPDLTWLNASVSYDFTKKFSVWVEATNLLNRHDETLPFLKDDGIVVTGGFRVLF